MSARGTGSKLALPPQASWSPPSSSPWASRWCKTSDAAYFDHYPLRDIHEGVRRFAAARGIRSHDLLADFRRQPPPPQRCLLDLWHLGAEGHRVVAEALCPDLFPPR